MTGSLWRVALISGLGLSAASQAFAALLHWERALGPPLWQMTSSLPLYAPWAIGLWAWRWYPQGRVAFWLAGVAGVMTMGLTAVLLRSPRRKPGEAHWATLQELREAECLGQPGQGVVLGMRHGMVLRYAGPGHVFFVGRTRSGKSTQLLSTLLDSTASMLIKDDKQELYPSSAGYRATLGPVYRLAPTDTDSDGYNPWEGIDVHADTAYRDLALISGYLVEHQTHGHQSSGAHHFQTMATHVLTALARYGLTTELATCGAELLTLADTSWTTLATLLLEQEDAEVQAAGQLLRELAPEPLGDLRSTVTNALGVFRDPRVARMTRTSSYPRGALRSGDRPVTVYWQVPFVDQERLRPLTRLFWHQTLQDCTSQLTGWRQRLQVIFEELPSLHYFPMASEGLNYAAGYQVQFLILTPSMEELTRWYTGHHNFLVGCHVQAIFGLNDAATARKVSERLGTTTVRKQRTTRQGGARSVSEEEVQEPLLSTTGVLQVPEDRVLLLVGRHATLANQARWYRHQPWKSRATLAVPGRTSHVALCESGGSGDGDAA